MRLPESATHFEEIQSFVNASGDLTCQKLWSGNPQAVARRRAKAEAEEREKREIAELHKTLDAIFSGRGSEEKEGKKELSSLAPPSLVRESAHGALTHSQPTGSQISISFTLPITAEAINHIRSQVDHLPVGDRIRAWAEIARRWRASSPRRDEELWRMRAAAEGFDYDQLVATAPFDPAVAILLERYSMTFAES
jgi:hypothetical protein